MTTWTVTYSYLANAPTQFVATDDEDLIRQVRAFADAKRGLAIGDLTWDGYTDENHVFFRRNGKSTRFMNLQCEG